MQDITCFYCHKPGHFRRNCSELRKAKTLQEMNQLSDSQLLETYPSTNQPEEDHDNSTNDQHTDSASQPATDDQHMTDSNVNRDSTTTTAISTSDNILNQHTSSQPIDNDHNMLDNNDDDQYIPTTKKQKTASATSLRITRSMSQHIQQSQ
ncbi:predicted protein [Lichtheimia corymbifera JMRC:FSU:9682]|uniref:CCHC-type domain-containing protein n=1 Tax=Lichtheimia corymbifera JMRC:FSU:9682 TaxID=1263082 RepID=A0A068RX99_9FUNG|nr:predicted protein [Lichtheimia corymbifera JMRC:FSU:9682]